MTQGSLSGGYCWKIKPRFFFYFSPERVMLNFNRLPTSVQTCCSFPLLAVLDYILINMQHGLVLTKNQLPVLVKKKKKNTGEHAGTCSHQQANMEALQAGWKYSIVSMYKCLVWNLVSISVCRIKRHITGLFVSKGSCESWKDDCRSAWEVETKWE